MNVHRQHHNLPQRYYETRMRRYLDLLRRVSHLQNPNPSYEDSKVQLFPIIRRKRNPFIPAEPGPQTIPANSSHVPLGPPSISAASTCTEPSPAPNPAVISVEPVLEYPPADRLAKHKAKRRTVPRHKTNH